MIVECGNCETRFQLDASRVPREGIRVRCSRCKEAFFLRHPSASAEEATHDVASSASARGTTAPSATKDLATGSGARESFGPDEREEDDWEFNDEPPSKDSNEDSIPDLDVGAGGESSGEDVDFRSESEAQESELRGTRTDVDPDAALDGDADGDTAGSGLSLAGESTHAGAGLDGDSDLETEGDRDLTTADGYPEEQVIGRSDLTEFGETSDFSDVSEEVGARDAGRARAGTQGPREPANRSAVSREFGEPEEWDLLSEDTLERPYVHDDAMARAMAAVAKTAQAGASEPRLSAAAALAFGGRVPRTRAELWGDGLGWALAVSLFVVGAGWGVLRAPLETATAPVVAPLGDFHAESVRGAWLETARAGRVYAVTGRLVNDGGQPLRPGSSLRVALVTASGGPLTVPPAAAGVPLDPSLLRELAPTALAPLQAIAASDLSWGPIEPGGYRDFLAYFVNVKDEAAGFAFEIENSQAPATEVLPAATAPELPQVEGAREPFLSGAAGEL